MQSAFDNDVRRGGGIPLTLLLGPEMFCILQRVKRMRFPRACLLYRNVYTTRGSAWPVFRRQYSPDAARWESSNEASSS